MIKVCLIGADVDKEKALLAGQPGIALQRVMLADLDSMLREIVMYGPDILVISDICGQLDADALCLHTYLRTPDIKTLIITAKDADYQRLEATGFSCKGFMLHEQRHALVRAVRVMNDGESWLSRKLVTSVLDHLAGSAASDKRKPQLVKKV